MKFDPRTDPDVPQGMSVELLQDLHLLTRDGHLNADARRKLKQIRHLVGLLRPAIDDALARHPDPLVVDCGAGKSYLGAMLYELVLGPAGRGSITAIEARPELSEQAAKRAARFGQERFRVATGAIGSFIVEPGAIEQRADAGTAGPISAGPINATTSNATTSSATEPSADAAKSPDATTSNATTSATTSNATTSATTSNATTSNATTSDAMASNARRPNVITALHACDTATDDALVLAIAQAADHVAVVPCCQAEVARQLEAAKPSDPVDAALFEHPLHRREFGSHLTNVIRALVLEAHGYKVTVTELVGWEHSAKNELILGKRVQRYGKQARATLRALLARFQVEPAVIRELTARGLDPRTEAT